VQGAIAGAGIGGFTAGVTGGNIGQGMLTGAISGAIFGSIGGLGLKGLAHTAAHFAGGSASGAINAEITGGNVGINALIGGISAGAGEWAGGHVGIFKLTGNYLQDVVRQAALGGIIGGGISSAFGGSFRSGFINGAQMSAIGYTANSYVHNFAPRIVNGILTGASFIPGPIGVGARVVRTVLTALTVGSEVVMLASGKRPANLPDNAVEHPNRPGKWGIYGPDGKFEEKWRYDVGKPGWGGDQGKDHVHVNGGKDHLPPDTPYPD
jgi:hypothetical protein